MCKDCSRETPHHGDGVELVQLANQAIELQRLQPALNSETLAESYFLLGCGLTNLGRTRRGDAEAALRQALALDSGHDSARSVLAELLGQKGPAWYKEAEALFRSLTPSVGAIGPLVNYSNFLKRLGPTRYADASQVLRQVLAIHSSSPVKSHRDPVLPAAQAALGDVLTMMGPAHFVEAELLLRGALPTLSSLDQDELRAKALDALSGLLRQQHRPEEAVPFCREALDIYRACYADVDGVNIHVAQRLMNLAMMLRDIGPAHFPEAEKLLREAVQKSRKLVDIDDSSLIISQALLAQLLTLRGGRMKEPVALFRAAFYDSDGQLRSSLIEQYAQQLFASIHTYAALLRGMEEDVELEQIMKVQITIIHVLSAVGHSMPLHAVVLCYFGDLKRKRRANTEAYSLYCEALKVFDSTSQQNVQRETIVRRIATVKPLSSVSSEFPSFSLFPSCGVNFPYVTSRVHHRDALPLLPRSALSVARYPIFEECPLLQISCSSLSDVYP